MHKFLIVLLAAACLTGCKRSAAPAPETKPADVAEAQLRKLAGTDATNCGRIAAGADVKAASDCAMQANNSKHPFYVAYDLPGGDLGMITFAFAGDAGGKVYRVEYTPKGWQGQMSGGELSDNNQVFTASCSAPLRMAQSGRVTCMPSLPTGGMSPHGGMMPAPGAASPHGGMMAAPDMANPHGGMMAPPGTANPHGDMTTLPPSHPSPAQH